MQRWYWSGSADGIRHWTRSCAIFYSPKRRSLTSDTTWLAPALALACVATFLSGCDATSAASESEQVATRDIWAGIDLESRGNGVTRVKVELNDTSSDGANVRLTPNERLDVEAGGIVVTLEEDQDFGDIDYEGTVPTDVGGTLFRIIFHRADGTIASGSFISIPGTFEITSPARQNSFPLRGQIPIVWSSTSSRDIELEVATRCPLATGGTRTSLEFFQIADNGSRSFDTDNLQIAGANDLAAGGVCDLEVALRRERRGNLDPAFRGGGFVRAIQIRRVDDMRLTLP